MSHSRAFIGAVAVIALLFIYAPLGILALVVFLIAGIAMWVTEGDSDARPCPRCGEKVPNGVLVCGHCSFDFGTIGSDGRGREDNAV